MPCFGSIAVDVAQMRHDSDLHHADAAHHSTSFLGANNTEGFQDFIRWRAEQDAPVPLKGPDGRLPDGMRDQRKIWGNWGSKVAVGGKVPGAEVSRMRACEDSEAQPPPMCANEPHGCVDLLNYARRMEGASKRSQQLMENALAAVHASQSMLMVAEKKAKDILKDETFSMGRQSEDDVLKQDDIDVKMLWGPWESGVPPTEPYHHDENLPTEMQGDRRSNIVTRWSERKQLDDRAVEYLNLVEGLTAGPSSFSIAAMASIAAASPLCVRYPSGSIVARYFLTPRCSDIVCGRQDDRAARVKSASLKSFLFKE